MDSATETVVAPQTLSNNANIVPAAAADPESPRKRPNPNLCSGDGDEQQPQRKIQKLKQPNQDQQQQESEGEQEQEPQNENEQQQQQNEGEQEQEPHNENEQQQQNEGERKQEELQPNENKQQEQQKKKNEGKQEQEPPPNENEQQQQQRKKQNEGGEGTAKARKRKIALLLAYCGAGYQGMQKNPGARTIEGELQQALYAVGAMADPDGARQVDWARAARTDKGVSAVGQVVSGWFMLDPSLVDRLNLKLPEQIRIFAAKRVTPSFSAKKLCDRRRYEYLLPLFALDPAAHRDRESSSGESCAECSDRGRKVPGLVGRRLPDGKIVNEFVAADSVLPKQQQRSEGGFVYGDEERARFNRVLGHFVGTHNFHNFTARTRAEDPSARRYILSFVAEGVCSIEGMEFVRCTVVGQSFMLHQIRKMMGLAVAVMRNCAPESIIPKALRKDVNMNVPTAPELGLLLDECLFPAYNQKWKNTHEEISLKGLEEQVSEFKHKHVYSHISSFEVKEGVVALWLHSLNQRNYSNFAAAWEEEKGRNTAGDTQAAAVSRPAEEGAQNGGDAEAVDSKLEEEGAQNGGNTEAAVSKPEEEGTQNEGEQETAVLEPEEERAQNVGEREVAVPEAGEDRSQS